MSSTTALVSTYEASFVRVSVRRASVSPERSSCSCSASMSSLTQPVELVRRRVVPCG